MSRTSLVAKMVKCLPTMLEIRIQSLGWEDLLEREMATHSSILAWKTHGQRSLIGYSPWGCRVGHNWATSLSFTFFNVQERLLSRRKWIAFLWSLRRHQTFMSLVGLISKGGEWLPHLPQKIKRNKTCKCTVQSEKYILNSQYIKSLLLELEPEQWSTHIKHHCWKHTRLKQIV